MTDNRNAAGTAELVMSVDIGTTAVKVMALSPSGEVAAASSRHYPTASPNPGWVEQNPEQWWLAAAAALRECTDRLAEQKLKLRAVSFSGHMSAPVLLDGDGRAVMPSIMIADARSSEETGWLSEHYGDALTAMTGNRPVDAFTAPKLLWVAKHRSEALRRAETLLFPKDFIRYRMTGSIGTEPTDAGNSLLYDIRRGDWANDLIEELGFARRLFPPLAPSHAMRGTVTDSAAKETGLPAGLPVVSGAADMACSQLGTGAVSDGVLAITLSTSGQVVMGVREAFSEASGKMTFHPSAVPGNLYAMGSIFTGGLGVDWAYRLLNGKQTMQASDYEAIGELSTKMEGIQPGSGGLMFLPFLVGSGSPYFDARDRASWLGLATGQSPELLLHSVMEGVAYNIRDSLELLEAGGCRASQVRLGGGGSKNGIWSRMIGDVLGKPIALLHNRDASAVGAAILAGVGCGWYRSAEEASRALVSTGEEIACHSDKHKAYTRIYAKYQEVYGALNRYYHSTVH